MYEASDAAFSPQRWLIGADHHVRPIWRTLIYLFLAVVAMQLAQRAALRLAWGAPQFAALALSRALMSLLLLIEAWMMCAAFDQRSFRSLGLWFYRGWWGEAGHGVLIGAGLIAAVAAPLVVGKQYVYGSAPTGSGLTPPAETAVAAVILLLAAAFEEILYRGYAFQRLVDSVGRLGGVFVLSALFGAAHLQNPGHPTALSTANTALAGVLLAAAYLKTRGLWMPIGLHWAWNFLMGPVLGMPVSGARFAGVPLRGEAVGPVWLSGGSYGPEGSILLTVACAGAIAWLWRSEHFAPSSAMAEVLELERGKKECPATPV